MLQLPDTERHDKSASAPNREHASNEKIQSSQRNKNIRKHQMENLELKHKMTEIQSLSTQTP